jgi:DUF917 family protein
MRRITASQLDHIALGAAVLGAGGGGDPYIGKLMARSAIERFGPVTLIGVDELDDDALVVPSAGMGAPTIEIEKLPRGDEAVHAFRALQAYLGRSARATMPIEAGGLNSMTPLTVAAELGIPLVDADGMGRAFPEIQMVTCTLAGVGATPMALADEKGNSVILDAIDNRWAETFARTITNDMGGSAMIALYAMTGRQVKEACVAGTFTQIETTGRAIRAAQAAHDDPIDAVRRVTGGFLVWRGKISDVARRTEIGFARGEVVITGTGDHEGQSLRIAFQNEFLIAQADDHALVTVPDLITILDAETGEPITTEELRYGFRVAVLGIPCDRRWRTPEGLKLVGPGYFGYDVPFVPVEARFGAPARV